MYHIETNIITYLYNFRGDEMVHGQRIWVSDRRVGGWSNISVQFSSKNRQLMRGGKWCKAYAYVSLIQRLVVLAGSDIFTMTIYSLR